MSDLKVLLPNAIQPYFGTIKGIALALIILVCGTIIARIIARLVMGGLSRRKVDPALSKFLSSLARYSILAAAVIASLGYVGVQTTGLVALFASAGLAIGLALQGSLANFAAGVMILFFRPIDLGEVVTVDGHTGKVDDIGLFATILITPNNEKIIIPNAKVTGGSIINLTTQGTRRGIVEVGVAYGTDVNKAQEVIVAAVKKCELVLADPAPAVALTGLGASSVDFSILSWCESPNYVAMQAQVRQAAYDSLNEAGIEIPFNQIVVHKADA